MNLHSYPFLRFTFFLIFGILFQFYYPIQITFSWISLVVLGSFYVFNYWYKNFFNFSYLIPCTCLFLGIILCHYHTEQNDKKHFSHYNFCTYKAKIISPPIFKKTHYAFEVNVCKIKQQSEWVQSTGKILVCSEKGKEFTYGQHLLIHAAPQLIKMSTNPYQFDFKRYYTLHNISHQSFLSGHEIIILKGAEFSIIAIAKHIQKYFLNQLKSQINQQEFSVLSALLLGDKSQLDILTKKNMLKQVLCIF